MKTNSSPSRDAQGSVLVITLSVIAVAAIVLASYLLIVQAQTASVARSQSWNSLISVSEAGVEEGLALINKGAPNIIANAWLWTNGVTSDGWTQNGSVYTMTRTLYNSNTYTVTVDITGGQNPIITATATVPYTSIPWVFSSAGGPFLAGGGTQISNSVPTVGRRIQIQTALNSLFNSAIVTRSNFNMNGNGTTVDSFDSSSVLYSTAGQYDSTKRKANGSVATDSSVIDSLSLGNGNIYGKVYTGPGTSQATSVQIQNNGSVGDLAWQNGGNSGIEPGFWVGNFNMNIQDVQTPTYSASAMPAAVGGVTTLNGGNYIVASDPGTLNITGPTVLWVQSSFSSGITIATNGNASLVLYLGKATGSGDSVSIGGNGSINQPGYAQNLQIYGLPSLTSVSFHGNAGFVGTIYAPEADMTGGGGGNNTQDTSGSMVVKSVTLNGHWNFHYDEHLTNSGPTRGWIAKNWAETKWP
jgi:hypothetical protein